MVAAASLVAQTVQINGAGATFPYPIYSKWFAEYNKLNPNVADQLPVASARAAASAADQSDGLLRRHRRADDGRAARRRRPARSCIFPTVLGAVVPVYNLPGVTAELKFTGPMLADIFLGKITKWNDPAIAKLNPG